MRIFDFTNMMVEEPPEGTVYRDVFSLMFFLFALLVFIYIVFLNPPGSKSVESAVVASIGDMTIYVTWPDNLNVDIDTWVWTSQEKKPIGYSNREGKYLNLLRDDLGTYEDESGKNFEIVASRGLPAGKWIINLHYYGSKFLSDKKLKTNVPVKVVIETYKNLFTSNIKKQIAVRNVLMQFENQEKTVVEFYLNKNGELLNHSLKYPDSTIPLRGLAEFKP